METSAHARGSGLFSQMVDEIEMRIRVAAEQMVDDEAGHTLWYAPDPEAHRQAYKDCERWLRKRVADTIAP